VDTHPRLSGTLGVKGGILSGVPGQVEPLKFSNPSGIGADAQGNIYVASDESGLVLESYAPTGTRNWEMHGLEFVECADIDPASSNDAYTQEHHYVLDLAKPSGQDSIYTGYLVNSAKYPEDPRANGYGCGSIFVRRLAGKKFLFGLDMNAGTLEIFRFTGEGEETAPSGLIRLYSRPGTKPTNQPAGAGCIWRDANGDGHFDTSEYELWNQSQGTTCWSIDTHGDIWTEGLASNDKSGDQHFMIRRLPFQGLDSLGNPIYSFKTETEVVAPEPFAVRAKGNGPERIQYVPESDTMYISGFTTDHPNQYRDWKTSGPVICCYDHWSTTPVLRWQIVVPFESVQVPHTTAHCPDAISVAGDRLFNGYAANGEIRVYDTHDGSYLGSLLPGPEVDHTSGWIDTMYGVRANQLADGSYLVFAEEVWHEKVLMYKWDGGK